MSKSITSFVCQECGYESPQWLGKCPECGNWNSFKEFRQASGGKAKAASSRVDYAENIVPQTLKQITYSESSRIKTGFEEMDNVLGGGIVKGSVTLVAGDPGIGKSTLLLQLALNVASYRTRIEPSKSDRTQNIGVSENQKIRQFEDADKSDILANRVSSEFNPKVLYISGEESVQQIKLRATRIKGALENENLLLVSLNSTEVIIELIEREKPMLVIIDSIQTVESGAIDSLSGSMPQVRFAATNFIKTAKSLSIPVMLVGHVTKEGMVAGPMILSHMVDTVLFLEGEKLTSTRILRSLKNRFGPVDEVGVFAMNQNGMNEIKNPEQLFLTKKSEATPGSMLVVIMEGTRPFLIEIQALVVYSKLVMPRRVALGVDHRRLELLLAVLQKQCSFSLENYDVFVNVAGGIKVTDPAIDLGICLAVLSSLKSKAFLNTIAIAEVGLLGEIREVTGLEKRIKEAKKLGFTSIISSKTNNSITGVVQSLGFLQKEEPVAWQQEGERKWKKK